MIRSVGVVLLSVAIMNTALHFRAGYREPPRCLLCALQWCWRWRPKLPLPVAVMLIVIAGTALLFVFGGCAAPIYICQAVNVTGNPSDHDRIIAVCLPHDPDDVKTEDIVAR